MLRFLVIASLMLSGCATIDHCDADTLADHGQLLRRDIDADGFVLRSYVRINDPEAPLRLYIEGDGRAWLTRTQPSADPTPHHATGLLLAVHDDAPNVAYLARPCQFNLDSSTKCTTAYWTDKRFSREVIQAMGHAIDALAAPLHKARIELVGYSGGAAIAVLIAAQRRDILNVRSVAGNLDSEGVNQHHRVSAMPYSLNPLDVATTLQNTPQIHFIGGKDTVIPASIAAQFIATQHGNCAKIIKVPEAAHETGWVDHWAALLTTLPACSP